MCRRHPECESDAVMAARCLGYVDAVVTGTSAPERAPAPTFAEGIVDLTRRNWEDYSRVFGVQIHGAGEAMEIPEPAPMPAEMVPKELQGVRALGQYTQRPISTAEYEPEPRATTARLAPPHERPVGGGRSGLRMARHGAARGLSL